METIQACTNIKSLQRKRDDRRGTIQKMKTYFDHIAGQSLAQIKTSDIQKKFDSLNENASACDVSQDCLDELHNKETAKAEEREVEEHWSWSANDNI